MERIGGEEGEKGKGRKEKLEHTQLHTHCTPLHHITHTKHHITYYTTSHIHTKHTHYTTSHTHTTPHHTHKTHTYYTTSHTQHTHTTPHHTHSTHILHHSTHTIHHTRTYVRTLPGSLLEALTSVSGSSGNSDVASSLAASSESAPIVISFSNNILWKEDSVATFSSDATLMLRERRGKRGEGRGREGRGSVDVRREREK
jgi:hypothetical protein